jgi:malate dehydrogenase (oxaloacetate-decarboxylating)(NADP+)
VQGLLVESRKESLQHFKKPFAHEHEELKTLLEAVQSIKPTVLIGTSGVGKTFTQEVIEAMASFNEVRSQSGHDKPITFLDSSCRGAKQRPCEKCRNLSSSRCRTRRRTRSARPRRPTPGARARRCLPFDPVEYEGKTFVPGQSNNAYVFPGFGLGVVISGAIRVHDDMLLAACKYLHPLISSRASAAAGD